MTAPLTKRQFPSHPSRRTRAFTLVETVLAIAVFSILMVAVFRFFSSSQKVWTSTTHLTEIYENSRVAFDVITRDLQCSMAQQGVGSGMDIQFQQTEPGSLWFVRSGPRPAGASSNIVEVAYKVEDGEFKRAARADTDSEWSPFGARSGLGGVPYATVADGVESLEFTCYRENGTAISVPTPAVERMSLPATVTVSITFLDKRSRKRRDSMPTERQQEFTQNVARTVSKTVFLAGRG